MENKETFRDVYFLKHTRNLHTPINQPSTTKRLYILKNVPELWGKAELSPLDHYNGGIITCRGCVKNIKPKP